MAQPDQRQASSRPRRLAPHGPPPLLTQSSPTHRAARMGIRLFGPFQVEWGSQRLGARDFGGTKPRQILQILAVECGRSVSRERLADLLWGEAPPRNVAATLDTYLSVLRHRLSPTDRAGHGLVVTEPGSYRLAADGVDLDVHRFDSLVRHASGRSRPAERLATLEEALDLALRGELVQEEPYAAWAETPRESYRRRVVVALLDAAHAAALEGDFARALLHAEDALVRDEFSERAWRAVMVALYGVGCEGQALRVYDRCVLRLTESLAVRPLPATDAVRAAIVERRQPDSVVELMAAWGE